jgi:hypothetical protein
MERQELPSLAADVLLRDGGSREVFEQQTVQTTPPFVLVDEVCHLGAAGLERFG